MQFQYDFMGGPVPQNLGLLVCGRCLDGLNYQNKLLILPPDPAPIFNTRPEPYAVDETNWLTTQDGDTLATQDDVPFTTSIPNPEQDADTSRLSAALTYPSGSLSVAYLDLFDGDPTAGGTSILLAVTGSATRTDIASSLETANSVATNTVELSVASAAAQTINVSYVGLYDAAADGTLLVSGPCSATFPTVVLGAAVVFDALALTIDLS
jgi:hypothetical protein